MPEIAEIARCVHFLRTRIVGRTLATVSAQEDANIFGKVGTSAAEFQSSLTGKKVVGAGQQGKYFWLVMESPPHPLFHFGMTGWLHLRDEHTYYHPPSTEMDAGTPADWPPKFTKFTFTTDGAPAVDGAFTDPRRFSRVRLLHCKGDDIRNVSPLKENGPDPVIDQNILTKDWLKEKMGARHVPIKAFLLDQATMSGVGNWVGDEVLYHAKIHPEQYCDTFSDAQVSTLHSSLLHITQTAVDLLADSSKFPEEWLFRHRWNKGKKGGDAGKMPNGEKIVFLTVGGRTSAVVPSRQKKTGAVAGDVKGEVKGEENEDEETKPASKGKKHKAELAAKTAAIAKSSTTKPKKGEANRKIKEEAEQDSGDDLEKEDGAKSLKPNMKKRKSTVVSSTPANTKVKRAKAEPESKVNGPDLTNSQADGRRRFGRAKK